MKQVPEFDVVIDKTGKMTVHISGAPGKDCLAFAELLKEIIGLEESRQLTSEYHQEPGAVRIQGHESGQLLQKRLK